jgi:protein arginine N-methyltransferase 1
MSCIREIAMIEPIVDIVDPDAIISNSCPILNLDIATCTKEDLAFGANFQLTMHRNDFCHAFVSYFDCAFTQCHKQIAFSTGPCAKYTHWKQTVFYTHEPITVCQGEVMKGRLECGPNSKNPRDLDITLKIDFEGQVTKVNRSDIYRLR